MKLKYTGQDIINMGFEPGPWFKQALEWLNGHHDPALTHQEIMNGLASFSPPKKSPLRDSSPRIKVNLEATTPEEQGNYASVLETMDLLGRTPTVVDLAVMPDACPAGPVGTIPVGGVAVTKGAIHPGMHSADICCSVMLTEFEDTFCSSVFRAIEGVTHFGPGGRENGKRFTVSPRLYHDFEQNDFLRDKKILQSAIEHMGTQGDGNHFAFVGRSKLSGNVCLVTHHGSRGPGAGLYKLGMNIAEKWRRKLSPETLKGNAWIPYDTWEGEQYWEALQLIRRWTKANHNCLHQAVADRIKAKVVDRYWNEHNFVFQEGDLFFHAKGATPLLPQFMPDNPGRQLIPLNMAEPVLVVEGERNDNNLGFAPHGAGRNLSRTQHKRNLGEENHVDVFFRETQGINAKFHFGNIDVSELPSAYKNATEVRRQIDKFDLCRVVDEIRPYGCIMAGDWERDMPWRKKREGRK